MFFVFNGLFIEYDLSNKYYMTACILFLREKNDTPRSVHTDFIYVIQGQENRIGISP